MGWLRPDLGTGLGSGLAEDSGGDCFVEIGGRYSYPVCRSLWRILEMFETCLFITLVFVEGAFRTHSSQTYSGSMSVMGNSLQLYQALHNIVEG